MSTQEAMTEVLAAVADVAWAGRVATGADGLIDLKAASKVLVALQSAGQVGTAVRSGDAKAVDDACGHAYRRFSALPSGTRGRERMLAAIAALRPVGSRHVPSAHAEDDVDPAGTRPSKRSYLGFMR